MSGEGQVKLHPPGYRPRYRGMGTESDGLGPRLNENEIPIGSGADPRPQDAPGGRWGFDGSRSVA